MKAGIVVILIIAVLVAIMFISSIRIVNQSYARVVERLGKYARTLNSGVNLVFPFFEKARSPISLNLFTKSKIAF